MPPRIGLDLVDKSNSIGAINAIKRAAALGVPMLWATTGRNAPDPMTYFAAALDVTEAVVLGTAIVPTYPRHPVMLATQALALDQLAPGRLRLGIGPSHRPTIEGAFGLPMGKPLDHLREYLIVLRALLSDGQVDFTGDYYAVHVDFGHTVDVPLYISALRRNAFRLAGELADGAISWICPLDYLREIAGPAMRGAAEQAGRPTPRMIAHIPVTMVDDRATMLNAARPRLESYGRLPFYANMFKDAGFPVGSNGAVSDDLIDHLVVWGDDAEVRARLNAAFDGGIDEVLVTLYTAGNPADEEARLCKILADLAR